MRMARKMGGHREPVADAVPARLGEYHVVLGSLSLHIVPKKTRHAALAFAVDGVGDAEPLFVKPKRPFFRVIVDADCSATAAPVSNPSLPPNSPRAPARPVSPATHAPNAVVAS